MSRSISCLMIALHAQACSVFEKQVYATYMEKILVSTDGVDKLGNPMH